MKFTLHAMSHFGDVLIVSDDKGASFILSGQEASQIDSSEIDFHIDKGGLLIVTHEPFENYEALDKYINENVMK